MAITPQSRRFSVSTLQCVLLSGAFLAATLLAGNAAPAQSARRSSAKQAQATHSAVKAHSHRHLKKQEQVEVAQTPPPPPMPNWPANDTPHPASVIWNSNGLRINASNSSLQQILNEVSTETGTKIEGPIPDQRVYGDYGPGQAGEVLSQLLQGAGCNVLLAGDIGKGAPREIVLSPRTTRNSNAPNNAAGAPQRDPDEDIPEDQSEDQQQFQPPPQPAQQPQMPNNFRPGFGPNGPIRTPQQVIEEMQQRQLQQQQQQQQIQQQQEQQQQQNPQ